MTVAAHKRHLEVSICAMVTILLSFYTVDKLRNRWTGRSVVVSIK